MIERDPSVGDDHHDVLQRQRIVEWVSVRDDEICDRSRLHGTQPAVAVQLARRVDAHRIDDLAAGRAGRHDLAAFFLENLMLPDNDGG